MKHIFTPISWCFLLSLVFLSSCSKDEKGFIKVYEPAVLPNAFFEVIEIENCEPPYRVHFQNLTTDTLGNENFLWDYGNGITSVFEQSVVVSYATAGDYEVKLIVANAVGTDTFTRTLNLPDTLPIESDFAWEAAAYSLRAPAPVGFINLSNHASTYTWEFGDGQTSTDKNPVHWYDIPGNYTVTLFSECGGREDQSFKNVQIQPPPSRLVINELQLQFLPAIAFVNADDQDGTVGLDVFFEAWHNGNKVLEGSTISDVLGGDLPIAWQTDDPIIISDFNSDIQIRLFDNDFNGYIDPISVLNVSLADLQNQNYPPEHDEEEDDVVIKMFMQWLD